MAPDFSFLHLGDIVYRPGSGAGIKNQFQNKFWRDCGVPGGGCLPPGGRQPCTKSGHDNDISEKVHRDSAIAIVVMSPLACFLLAPGLKASGHRGLWIYSMIAGTIAVVTVAVGFLIPTGHSDFLGVFERILLLNGQMWGEIICVRLIWTAFKPKPTQASIDSNRLRLLQIYANSHSEGEQ